MRALRLFLVFLGCFLGPLAVSSSPAAASPLTLSGNLLFSSLDGSAQDADGLANGVFTVDGDLVLAGTINCNDEPPLLSPASACPIRLAVTGSFTMEEGSGLYAENRRGPGSGGDITLTVGGDLILHGPADGLPGAVVSSSKTAGVLGHAGNVSANVSGSVQIAPGAALAASAGQAQAGGLQIVAGGAIDVGGLLAAGPSRTVLASRWSGDVLQGGNVLQEGGSILVRSSGGGGLTVGPEGVVVSQGAGGATHLVLLEACGIEIRGVVASLSGGSGPAQVALRSGRTIMVDGRDLGSPAAPTGRFGRVRADSSLLGAAANTVDLFAAGDLQLFGPNAAEGLAAVTASPGSLPLRTGGTITAISLSGALTAGGDAMAAGRADGVGDHGGALVLAAAADVQLDGAGLRAVGDSGPPPLGAGGTIAVRSYHGDVSWTFGTGDVRPTGSAVLSSRRGAITLTACGQTDVTGSQFPVNGSAVGTFPSEHEGVCSPTAPSLPQGEPPLQVCNRPPVAADQSATTSEDHAVTLTLTGSDPDGDPLTFAIVTPPAHGTLGPLTSPTPASVQVVYTPAADFNGGDSFTFQVDDGESQATGTVSLTVTPVNDAPAFTAGPDQTVGEDAGPQMVSPWATAVSAGPANEAGQSLTFEVTGNTSPGLFAAGPAVSTTGALAYTPAAGVSGTASITLVLHDDGGTADGGVDTSSSRTFTITVLPVNDAPTFVKGPDVSVNDNAGPQTLSPWATAISAGPPDEAGQTLTFQVIGNTNPGAFAAGPAISPTGVLTFTPAEVPAGTLNATITVVLHDDGGTANGGVDTSAPQSFVISITHVNHPPVLVASPQETFDTVGNTLLEFSATPAASGPRVTVAGSLVANFTDTDGPSPLAASLVAASAGAVVTVNADGTFTYLPPAGATGSDTFTYRVTDGAASVDRTVTVHLLSRVWYVKNDADAGGIGRSADPFDTLAEAESASTANDVIFVLAGDGTSTGQDAGIVLKNGQRLLGEGVELALDLALNGQGAPVHLLAAGDFPQIDGAAGGNAVSAADAIPAEIAGLSLAGALNGIDVTTSAAFAVSGDLEIHDVTVRSAGLEGIDVNAGGSGALTLRLRHNDVTAATNGIDVQRLAGTVFIADLSDNVVRPATGGSGIVVTGPVTFDAVPGGAIDPVSGGTTVIGMSGDGVGGSALVLSGVGGSLSFSSLGAYADGGAAVRVSGLGAANTLLGIASGMGTLVANGGPALDLSALTAALPLVQLTSVNSPTTGVSLTGIAGNIGASSASSISNITSAAGTAFQVANSSAAIAYAGTLNTSTGKGVELTNNSGSTIGFSGTLTLSSGANPAFTATGGGTVTATDTASSLATTTGTALNVANTTIGSAGLKFRSISAGTAASGPASGIVLNNTGSSGGLSVLGSGSAGSGGTIRKTTSHGMSLNGTWSPSFARMSIKDTGGSGIKGTAVTNFTFTNGAIDNSGTGLGINESSIAFNDSALGTENNLSGAVSITDSTLTNAYYHGIDLSNASGTLSAVTITGNTITSSTSTASSKGSGIRLQALGSTTTVAGITRAMVSNNVITNFPAGNGVVVSCGNPSATGTGGTCGTPGSATDVVTVAGNTIRGQSAAAPMGSNAIVASVTGGNGGSRSQANFNLSNNGTAAAPLTNFRGSGIGCSVLGMSTAACRVSDNVMVANNSFASRCIAVGVDRTTAASDTPDLTATISNNSVSSCDGNGIFVGALNSNGVARLKVLNNSIAAPLSGVRTGIQVNSGSAAAGTNTSLCVALAGNTSAGSGGLEGIGLRKEGTAPATNAFAVDGMTATSSPGVESYVSGLNPAGGGVLLNSATSGFTNCSLP